MHGHGWQRQGQGRGYRTPFADVSQLEAVFQAYGHGNLDDLKARLAPLDSELAQIMRRALALLALQDRKLDILSYILADGQTTYDPPGCTTFHDRALRAGGYPDMDEELRQVIWDSPWSRNMRAQVGKPGDCGAPPGREAEFDHIPW